MRVLVAMSGGVDSSMAAALLVEAGEQVVGATMKLWGGPSDTGCCSVADVEDARRVAQQLGIIHHVFNFSEDFGRHVVDPYVADHASGRTPNPCVECNRHLKFDRLLQRAQALGFDAVATGHYARVVAEADGRWSLRRGQDPAKDQSYVLHMLGQDQLSRIRLPLGDLTKEEVRSRASGLGLRTAMKPDSQDVCFISRVGGRQDFLGSRIDLRPGRIVDSSGTVIGTVPAIELITIGQRRGLGALPPPAPAPALAAAGREVEANSVVSHAPLAASDRASPGPLGLRQETAESPSHPASDGRRYVVDIDLTGATATLGPLEVLLVREVRVREPVWVDGPPDDGAVLEVQVSAHGQTARATWSSEGMVRLLDAPIRRVAPGQSVVLYRGDAVVGGGPAI
jgi:tRNA-specific 2-thiouridylase